MQVITVKIPIVDGYWWKFSFCGRIGSIAARRRRLTWHPHCLGSWWLGLGR